jgi:DNA-binding NtrC family response regulator
MAFRILLAESDRDAVQILKPALESEGYQVRIAASAEEAMDAASHSPFEFFILEVKMLGTEEMSLLHFIRTRSPQARLILISDPADAGIALRAAQQTAAISLLKPVRPDDLLTVLSKIRSVRTEEEEAPRDDIASPFEFQGMTGGSVIMRRVLRLAVKVAPTDTTVIITGETGTGKEMVARVIQRLSRRAERPFVTLNCGAIPENLVESELFGHKRGAFTDAVADKKGLMEMANLGTLLLDEISELPLAAQVKLLRSIEDMEIRRVGDVNSVRIDVRVLAATNKDLQELVRNGRFREDLWFRLNVIQIHLPPLRDRREDIPPLMRHFLNEANRRFAKNVVAVAPDALAVIAHYDYPGNVRELRNVIEHAVVMADHGTIRTQDLPVAVVAGASRHRLIGQSGATVPAPGPSGGDFKTLSQAEKELIQWTLGKLAGNQTEVARKLGISRSTLWRKIREYGVGGGQ